MAMIHVNFLHRISSAVAQITSPKNLHARSVSLVSFPFGSSEWRREKKTFFHISRASPGPKARRRKKRFSPPAASRSRRKSLNFDRHEFFVYFIDNIARLSSVFAPRLESHNATGEKRRPEKEANLHVKISPLRLRLLLRASTMTISAKLERELRFRFSFN